MVQKGPAAWGLRIKNEIYLKKLLLQNCLAQMLEIWYVALPGGHLPSLFKPRSKDPRWPCARGGPRLEP